MVSYFRWAYGGIMFGVLFSGMIHKLDIIGFVLMFGIFIMFNEIGGSCYVYGQTSWCEDAYEIWKQSSAIDRVKSLLIFSIAIVLTIWLIEIIGW